MAADMRDREEGCVARSASRGDSKVLPGRRDAEVVGGYPVDPDDDRGKTRWSSRKRRRSASSLVSGSDEEGKKLVGQGDGVMPVLLVPLRQGFWKAVGRIKRPQSDLPMESGLAIEREMQQHSFQSEDAKRKVSALTRTNGSRNYWSR